jgi:predicted kinase
MAKLVMLMAPPCVGKTVIAKHIKETHKDCKIISKTDILKLYPQYNILSSELNRIYCNQINDALKLYDIVIADDTQTTIESRNRVFANLNLKHVKVIGVWIESALKSALSYNETRPPEEYLDPYIIKEIFRYSVSPAEKEPFDDVIYFNRDTCLGIGKTNPKIDDAFNLLTAI